MPPGAIRRCQLLGWQVDIRHRKVDIGKSKVDIAMGSSMAAVGMKSTMRVNNVNFVSFYRGIEPSGDKSLRYDNLTNKEINDGK